MKMEVLTYPQKGRLETIIADLTDGTTTWFDGTGNPESVKMITDLDGNLLITLDGWRGGSGCLNKIL